jgi:nucleolar protein 14
MQRRNKVGGIHDRRFGEDDPTMAPEDKMLERFTREKQRSHKKSMFDLEDDEPTEGLTHMGQSLTFDGPNLVDDYNEEDSEMEESESSSDERKKLKRSRVVLAADEDNQDGRGDQDADQPDRKKTKREVMKEVMAKSKLHKYERQAAKEEDNDLRLEMNQELSAVQELLHSATKPSKVKPETSLTIAGVDKSTFEKELNRRAKQLALEPRSQPAYRTKTDEEKAEEAATKLKELEEKRQRRMRGEPTSDDEDNEEDGGSDVEEKMEPAPSFNEQVQDNDFGLGKGIKTRATATELGFDDEDDFIIEDDLIDSGSEFESLDESEASDGEEDKASEEKLEDEEDDLTGAEPNPSKTAIDGDTAPEDGLPYTFSCPQSLDELRAISDQYPPEKLPIIVQRIRALYHPKLDSKNKEALSGFSMALVDYIAEADASRNCPPAALESLIRHIHSLAKSFPVPIATQFRHHIEEIGRLRPLALHRGDLLLLAAVGTIFPTSDHFHQVVTPAMLTLTRFLGQKIPQSLADYSTGTYLAILTVQYQHLSQRYIPEVVNFCLNTLCALGPLAPKEKLGNFPVHEPRPDMRIQNAGGSSLRKLRLDDCDDNELSAPEALALKVSLVDTNVRLLQAAADAWSSQPSFFEIFEPAVKVMNHLTTDTVKFALPISLCENAEKTSSRIGKMLNLSRLSRRPLELHHHRPLGIRTFIPKFEDTFNPSKHYDPDRDRAEGARLRAEFKKERKGAMRELRKDANFMAREKLRIKKAKDAAYEKKFSRLVAEIQGEEGREANAYEREKEARKKARTRKW